MQPETSEVQSFRPLLAQAAARFLYPVEMCSEMLTTNKWLGSDTRS